MSFTFGYGAIADAIVIDGVCHLMWRRRWRLSNVRWLTDNGWSVMSFLRLTTNNDPVGGDGWKAEAVAARKERRVEKKRNLCKELSSLISQASSGTKDNKFVAQHVSINKLFLADERETVQSHAKSEFERRKKLQNISKPSAIKINSAKLKPFVWIIGKICFDSSPVSRELTECRCSFAVRWHWMQGLRSGGGIFLNNYFKKAWSHWIF